MLISIAQIRPIKGDISANIDRHRILIGLASSMKSSAIFFPELSLTSYEPQLAKELAMEPNDPKLDIFQMLSDTDKITIGLGAPLKTAFGVQISMIVFRPNLPRQTYSKQLLHADELPWFTNGNEQLIIEIDNKKIAPAICYESLQVEHSDKAKKLGAEIYVASVAKSQNGIDKAYLHYPLIAKKYSIPVLMSNCLGYCDNFESIGKSAVWNRQGKLVGQLDEMSEGILMYNTDNDQIIEQRI